jgi:hypothetical protein
MRGILLQSRQFRLDVVRIGEGASRTGFNVQIDPAGPCPSRRGTREPGGPVEQQDEIGRKKSSFRSLSKNPTILPHPQVRNDEDTACGHRGYVRGEGGSATGIT